MIEPLRYYQETSTTYEIERPAFCVSCLSQRQMRNNPNIATSFCAECPASFLHLNKQAINSDKQFGAFLCRTCEMEKHNKPLTEKHKRQTIVVGPGIRKKVLARGDGINFPSPLDTVTVKMKANIFHNGRRVHKEDSRTLSFVTGLSGRCLHIQLLGARNLIVGDANGTSDPFIVATYCGRQIHSTRVRQRTLNPHWNNETVIIPVDDNMIMPSDCPPSQRNLLQLACYDRDWLSANESLGRAEINTSRLLQLAAVANGQPLRIPLTMRTAAGIANLRLGHDDHYLYIELKGAEDLPRRDPLALFSLTWARFSLGDSTTIGDTFTARGGGANVSWMTSTTGKGLVFKVPMEKVLLEERRRVRMIAFYLASVGPLPAANTSGGGGNNYSYNTSSRPASGGRRRGLQGGSPVAHSTAHSPAIDSNSSPSHANNANSSSSSSSSSPKRQQGPIDAFSAFNQLPSFLALLHLSIYEGRAPPSTSTTAKVVLGSPLLATAALHVDTIRQLLPSLPPALPLDGEEDAPVGMVNILKRGLSKGLTRAASSVSFRSSSRNLNTNTDSIGRGYRLSTAPQKSSEGQGGLDLYEQANNGSVDDDDNHDDNGNHNDEGSDGLDSFNRPAGINQEENSQVSVSLASHQEDGNGNQEEEDDEEMQRHLTNDNTDHNDDDNEEEEEEDEEPSQLSDSQRPSSSNSSKSSSNRLPPPSCPPPPPLSSSLAINTNRGEEEDDSQQQSEGEEEGEEEEEEEDMVPALPPRTSFSQQQDINNSNDNRRSLIQKAMSFAPSTAAMHALGRGLSQAVETALGPSQLITWAPPLRLQLESTLPGAMLPKDAASGNNNSGSNRQQVEDYGYLVVRLLPASRGVVLAGLDAAVQRMTIGETSAVKCRYDQAYGSFCLTSVIPPRANILFTVSLTGISRGGVATLSVAESASFLLQLPIIGVFYRFIARLFRGLYSLYSLGFFGAATVLFAMCKGDKEALNRSIHESQRKAKKKAQANRDRTWFQMICFCFPSSKDGEGSRENNENEDEDDEDNDSNDDDDNNGRSKGRRKGKSSRRNNNNDGFDLNSDSDYSDSNDNSDSNSDNSEDEEEDGEEEESEEAEQKYNDHPPRTIKPDGHIKRHINTSVRAGGSLLWNYSIQAHRDPPPVSHSSVNRRGGGRKKRGKGILKRSSSTKRGMLRSESSKLHALHALMEEDGEGEEDDEKEENGGEDEDEKSDD